jgi:hypothetical protein
MGGESSKEIADIVRLLEARGGQEQLLLLQRLLHQEKVLQ